MGRVVSLLDEHVVAPSPACTPTRLISEDNRDGTFHLHHRNVRLDFDAAEFIGFAEHVGRALGALRRDGGTDEDDGRPGAGYHVLARDALPPAPRRDPAVLRVELNDDEAVHVHLRNLRIDLRPGEFLAFADTLTRAAARLRASGPDALPPAALAAELRGLGADLAKASVRHSLLWSWASLPHAITGGDIDLAVHPDDLDAMIEVLRRRGWHGGTHPAYEPTHGGPRHEHLSCWIRLEGSLLPLDVTTGMCIPGRCLLPDALQDALWALAAPDPVRGLRAPPIELELVLILVRALHITGMKARYADRIRAARPDRARLVTLLDTCFAQPHALADAVIAGALDALAPLGGLRAAPNVEPAPVAAPPPVSD